MRRNRLVVALVLVVLLAGCAGLSGDGGSNATPDGESAADGGATDGRSMSLDGPHPHTEGDTLTAASLMSAHLETLRAMETFALTDTITVSSVANGSVQARVITEKRFDLGSQRVRIERRQETSNGTESRIVALYQNATTQCTRRSGSVQCRERAFDPNTALGRVVEITSLETVAAPAFGPNGTTTIDGHSVYRFSATALRADPPERALSELGRHPSIDAATLFVSPDGHIVRYDVSATVDGESGRVRIERSYRIAPTDGSPPAPPEWVPS